MRKSPALSSDLIPQEHAVPTCSPEDGRDFEKEESHTCTWVTATWNTAGQTQPVQSCLPRHWGWRFQNVSCCFQPGGSRCLGCMSQRESHLQPHRDACSLPEIKYSHMLSDSETVGPRPNNLVTKDGYGSPREMGASLGSPKLVKRNMNWKHGDSSATYLCNIFICKTWINYCFGLGSPKADPGRRIWAQVLYQGGDYRKHKWERKENEMTARKWATHHSGQWGPLSWVPSQDTWVMHLRIVPTKDAESGISTNFCHLLVKYCL